MSNSVYIAGVGITHPKNGSQSTSSLNDTILSAGTKALLDAGVTYNDVKASIACFLDRNLTIGRNSFETFGRTGTPVYKVDNYSGLHVASQFVRSGTADCVMVIGFDQGYSRRILSNYRVAAVSFILVSDLFLRSHAYLKDSSIKILSSQVKSPIHSNAENADDEIIATRTAINAALEQSQLLPEDIQIMELRHGSDERVQAALGAMHVTEDNSASAVSHPFIGRTGFGGMCELVWQLRGWTQKRSVKRTKNCLQFTLGPDGTAYVTVLCRSDERPAPEWSEVEHVRDGRERQGHNPAIEIRDIMHEDWLAVKARDNFVSREVLGRLRLPKRGGDRAALARL